MSTKARNTSPGRKMGEKTGKETEEKTRKDTEKETEKDKQKETQKEAGEGTAESHPDPLSAAEERKREREQVFRSVNFFQFEHNGAQTTAASVKGHRKEMQDVSFHKKLPKECEMFAVVDGHGERGDSVAHSVKALLESAILNLLRRSDRDYLHDESCLTKVVENLHKTVLLESGRKGSGATVVCGLITHPLNDSETRKCTVFHVGDSRALLVRDGKIVESTRDHIPLNTNEAKRIKEKGGFVHHFLDWGYRAGGLCGALAVSRSIGDRNIQLSGKIPQEKFEDEMDSLCDKEKEDKKISKEELAKVATSCSPSFFHADLTDGDQLMLFSDGLTVLCKPPTSDDLRPILKNYEEDFKEVTDEEQDRMERHQNLQLVELLSSMGKDADPKLIVKHMVAEALLVGCENTSLVLYR